MSDLVLLVLDYGGESVPIFNSWRTPSPQVLSHILMTHRSHLRYTTYPYPISLPKNDR